MSWWTDWWPKHWRRRLLPVGLALVCVGAAKATTTTPAQFAKALCAGISANTPSTARYSISAWKCEVGPDTGTKQNRLQLYKVYFTLEDDGIYKRMMYLVEPDASIVAMFVMRQWSGVAKVGAA